MKLSDLRKTYRLMEKAFQSSMDQRRNPKPMKKDRIDKNRPFVIKIYDHGDVNFNDGGKKQ